MRLVYERQPARRRDQRNHARQRRAFRERHHAGARLVTAEPLGFGSYLGLTCWQRRCSGLLLTLTRYRPGLTHGWHVHAHPTAFLLLEGTHRDRSRRDTRAQPTHTAVFHPVTEPHATEVGPEGMFGLNVEYSAEWLDAHGLRTQDLNRHHLLAGPAAQLRILRLLGGLFTDSSSAEADLQTAAFELVEPVLAREAAVRPARPARWLPRTEEFLRQSFRQPLSLRCVAREVGVHPVYCARAFR